jgi:hypothetical protein
MSASTSSSSAAVAAASLIAALGSPPSEKLSRDNHLFWKTQVLPAFHCVQAMGLLDGTDSAPPATEEIEDTDKNKIQVPSRAYAVWFARDQALMSYLVKSLDQDLLAQMIGLTHSHQIWSTIQSLFASQSRARVNFLRGALINTKKQDMTARKYIATMQGFVQELAAAGKTVDQDELKGYILGGLDDDRYTPFVTLINANPTTTCVDMCSQLQAFDDRQTSMSQSGQSNTVFQSSANTVARYYSTP